MLLKDIIAADPEWAKKAPVSPEAHRALYLPNWEVFNRNLKKGDRLLEPGDPQVASAEALSRPATAAAHLT